MENYNGTRATISFHLTQEEKDNIIKQAEENGLTITDYIKNLVLWRIEEQIDIEDLLSNYNIQPEDLEEVLVGWSLLMEDDIVCKLLKELGNHTVRVRNSPGFYDSWVETKLDIILLKIWAQSELEILD